MPTLRDAPVRRSWILLIVSAALSIAAPAAAADEPAAAVDELVDMVANGDLTGIDGVVCASEIDAAMAQFDPASAFGLPSGAAATPASLRYTFGDRVVEVIEQGPDEASVRLTGTLSLEIDESEARDFVRAVASADGAEISDSDLELIMPAMLAGLRQARHIDEELDLTREDDRWLVCGGLGTDAVDPAPTDRSVSFEGICGLVSLADLNAVSPESLRYDSSFGSEDYCSFESSSYEATLSLDRDGSLDGYRSSFPGGDETRIAGRAAYGQGDQLFIQLDEGVLELTLFTLTGPDGALDSAAYLGSLAELFAPLMAELEVGDGSAIDDGTLDALGLASLCDAVGLDELDALSPLVFDDATGGADYCDYSVIDPDVGFHVVSTSLNALSVEDFRALFPDGRELTVGGLPAYAQDDQVWVQLEGSEGSFSVGAFIEGSPGSDSVDPTDLAVRIAELAIPDLRTDD